MADVDESGEPATVTPRIAGRGPLVERADMRWYREIDMMLKLKRTHVLLVAGVLGVMVAGPVAGQRYLRGVVWPQPPVVTPGDGTLPPSDAIVLFDGKNLDAWDGVKKTKIDEDGAFTVAELLRTKQKFGDCQLHVEFASPKVVTGKGQGRGNNGIGLMGARYEIQVLDSFDNPTYPEGSAASIYNQTPPMVNASRKPGEWQTYDIIWTAPQFGEDSKVTKPAYATVLHNGVMVQNHTEVLGNTFFDQKTSYSKHGNDSLVLMYHGNPVRFRNIWIREFKALESKPGKAGIEGK
jgi:Domain of Unknown Function (DUF1080)